MEMKWRGGLPSHFVQTSAPAQMPSNGEPDESMQALLQEGSTQ